MAYQRIQQIVRCGIRIIFSSRGERLTTKLEMKVARNLSLAIGRHTPSFGIREMIGEALDALAMIGAAARVGYAVDSRTAPDESDLKRLGLENADVLRPPYRF